MIGVESKFKSPPTVLVLPEHPVHFHLRFVSHSSLVVMFSLFSSFTVYADAPEEKTEEKVEEPPKEEEEQKEEEEAAPAEEEEEEEPEDVRPNAVSPQNLPLTEMDGMQIYPAIREECEQSKACSGAAKHFQHCQVKRSSPLLED